MSYDIKDQLYSMYLCIPIMLAPSLMDQFPFNYMYVLRQIGPLARRGYSVLDCNLLTSIKSHSHMAGVMGYRLPARLTSILVQQWMTGLKDTTNSLLVLALTPAS